MWEIWANLLMPQALKSCPKSIKSPNLVTLAGMQIAATYFGLDETRSDDKIYFCPFDV